jgi:hypothetical protein
MSIPGRSSGMNPRRTSEIDALVVSAVIGTEMPYPSSHTESAIGTCRTPAALTASQKRPSLVEASPMVPKATSLPLTEKPSCTGASCGFSRYSFDAYARPTRRGIQPATFDTSALEFAMSTVRRNSPASSRIRVAKWLPIWRPPDAGSASRFVLP